MVNDSFVTFPELSSEITFQDVSNANLIVLRNCISVKNNGAGSGAVQVMFVDGVATPISLQSLPAYPGLNSAFNDVFKLGPDSVMACDGDKSCWSLKPGIDPLWNPAGSMLYTQQKANKDYFDFGNEIMLLASST